jgi:hypothetical protein
MQLPREQLKEILERQPEMKPGLWQYVLAKNGPVKAQTYAEVSGSGMGPAAVADGFPSFSSSVWRNSRARARIVTARYPRRSHHSHKCIHYRL